MVATTELFLLILNMRAGFFSWMGRLEIQTSFIFENRVRFSDFLWSKMSSTMTTTIITTTTTIATATTTTMTTTTAKTTTPSTTITTTTTIATTTTTTAAKTTTSSTTATTCRHGGQRILISWGQCHEEEDIIRERRDLFSTCHSLVGSPRGHWPRIWLLKLAPLNPNSHFRPFNSNNTENNSALSSPVQAQKRLLHHSLFPFLGELTPNKFKH